jgi:ABC-type transporter Mla subunit MlaD
MGMQTLEIAALMLFGVLAGAALPVLWELRSTLRAARGTLGTTGKRLDTALDAWAETAGRINHVAAELNDGTNHVKNFLTSASDLAATLQELRSQVRVAVTIGAAVVPAVVAAFHAFHASGAGVGPHQENGASPDSTVNKESADA